MSGRASPIPASSLHIFYFKIILAVVVALYLPRTSLHFLVEYHEKLCWDFENDITFVD